MRVASVELGSGTAQSRFDGAEGEAELVCDCRDGNLVDLDAEQYSTKPGALARAPPRAVPG
jgi:hypothetical protein